MQSDPIGFFGLDANLYAYSYNNPSNVFDPSGTFAIQLGTIVVGTALVVGAIVLNANRPPIWSPLPRPLDPWTETGSTAYVPTSNLPQDKCQKEYDDCMEEIKCSGLKYHLLATKCSVLFWVCNNSGPSNYDGDSGTGTFPGLDM